MYVSPSLDNLDVGCVFVAHSSLRMNWQLSYNYAHFSRENKNIVISNVNYYSVCCLTTGPKPLPKRFLHIVQSKVSSFKWEYPLLSLRSSSSFLRLLLRLLVTSISPFIGERMCKQKCRPCIHAKDEKHTCCIVACFHVFIEFVA